MNYIDWFNRLNKDQKEKVIKELLIIYKQDVGTKKYGEWVLNEGLFSGPAPDTKKGLNSGPFPSSRTNCSSCGRPM